MYRGLYNGYLATRSGLHTTAKVTSMLPAGILESAVRPPAMPTSWAATRVPMR